MTQSLSGSAHRKSQISPVSGTSVGRTMRLTWQVNRAMTNIDLLGEARCEAAAPRLDWKMPYVSPRFGCIFSICIILVLVLCVFFRYHCITISVRLQQPAGQHTANLLKGRDLR